jgi:hypothetical protein
MDYVFANVLIYLDMDKYKEDLLSLIVRKFYTVDRKSFRVNHCINQKYL